MSDIRFGTDGWRAVIAKGFTFDNLNKVSQATGRWIEHKAVTQNGVIIGYDSRFMSREFAEQSATVFAAMGIPVRIASSIVPTPAVSWAAAYYDAVGIIITASHNPPQYSGFKIKAPFGGPATPAQIDAVESELDNVDPGLITGEFDLYLKRGQIREIPLFDSYLEMISERIDLAAIRESNIKIAHDPMFGAGMNILKELLGEQVIQIHGEVNPSFMGTAPEPIERNLIELSRTVPGNGCAIGLANDGDADRIGIFDETGRFVNSHQILSLLVTYLHTEKGLSGTIIKTFSTTNMLDKQADRFGLELEVTPIGFKYIAEKIVGGDVLVGGEESGGLAVKGHIPERDGIYIGLLITEMMVKAGKKLSELVQDLFDEFGFHATSRADLQTENSRKESMIEYCRAEKLTSIAGLEVLSRDTKDGIKHLMSDGSWLLVRPSGTEPLLRIYSEASSQERADQLVSETVRLVESDTFPAV